MRMAACLDQQRVIPLPLSPHTTPLIPLTTSTPPTQVDPLIVAYARGQLPGFPFAEWVQRRNACLPASLPAYQPACWRCTCVQWQRGAYFFSKWAATSHLHRPSPIFTTGHRDGVFDVVPLDHVVNATLAAAWASAAGATPDLVGALHGAVMVWWPGGAHCRVC